MFLQKAKSKIASYIYSRPTLHMRVSGLNRLLGRAAPPEFSGWGMTTCSTPPWKASLGELDIAFNAVNEYVQKSVSNGDFKLSIFHGDYDVNRELQRLTWRNYIVYWSAFYAAKSTPGDIANLAECGVCDGLSTFYALSAMRNCREFSGYLYDAWEVMRSDTITKSESSLAGQYDFLSLDNTKRNLKDFINNVVFIKGYLPESFQQGKNPQSLSWLHIDLNSSVTTTAVLKYFIDKILPGGIILFDDYAHPGYQETRECIDTFLKGEDGIFLPMPTGQGVFFKH
ncbi:MAG: class I SAM-dependent methyltransferase [Terrimicrobiaceae bacterium]